MDAFQTPTDAWPQLDCRAGITDLLEVVVIFPALTLMIFLMVYLGRAWYVRAALEDAAAAGARWAPTSLSGTQGCAQARRAMNEVISKYHLNPAGAEFNITLDSTSLGRWGRGARAIITAQYRIDQSVVPVAGAKWGNPTISTRLVVPVDYFNNRYTNGWEVCH
ncbi:MAG: hypothetical protein HC853_00265 [Anaerolineae bacterium]|nr:hypothetical protein [Anaerolineae bacterium]